jgi:pyruvyltransferase
MLKKSLNNSNTNKTSQILAFWYKDNLNFGDLLNPYIMDKLFNKQLIYRHYYTTSFYLRALIANFRRKNKLKLPSRKSIVRPFEDVLFGIGSILDYASSQTLVWGTGFREHDSDFLLGTPKKIHAVRGKLSIKRLKDLGVKFENIAYGDPALLLPLIYPKDASSEHKIGIFPHYIDYEFFKETYKNKYQVINPLNSNIESVIDEIMSCECILSTSLHGIIVAHSYNIPAIWIKNEHIGTGNFKFHDYFSSVDIPAYEGFTNFKTILESEENIIKLFLDNKDLHSIKINIETIQNNLINSFPK